MGGARVSDYPGPTFLGAVCGAVSQPRGGVLAPSPSLFAVSIESGLDSRLRPGSSTQSPGEIAAIRNGCPQAPRTAFTGIPHKCRVVPQAPRTAFTDIPHKRLRRPTGATHSLYWYSPQALASPHRHPAPPSHDNSHQSEIATRESRDRRFARGSDRDAAGVGAIRRDTRAGAASRPVCTEFAAISCIGANATPLTGRQTNIYHKNYNR